ncbi:MAG: BrnT family toxin [Rectinemataceae bacterium]
MIFEWDEAKDRVNQIKHGVSFLEAQEAFVDPDRLMYPDVRHLQTEKRYFCLGMASGRVLTVRFTSAIRILGAGHWRKGVDEYENRNQT